MIEAKLLHKLVCPSLTHGIKFFCLEATKKIFFSGLASNALPPPPSSLVATFFGGIFLELQKKYFFLSDLKEIKLQIFPIVRAYF